MDFDRGTLDGPLDWLQRAKNARLIADELPRLPP